MLKNYRILFYIFFIPLAVVQVEASSALKKPFSSSHRPKFEEYKVPSLYKGKVASLQLKHPTEARKYKTALQQGLKAGPNFAGHYTIVSIGCGTNCQVQWIIDAKTGKVLPQQFVTEFETDYRKDSKLLILNPIKNIQEYKKEFPDTPLSWTPKTTYIILEEKGPKVIYEEESKK